VPWIDRNLGTLCSNLHCVMNITHKSPRNPPYVTVPTYVLIDSGKLRNNSGFTAALS
jgi:hypothetical protein